MRLTITLSAIALTGFAACAHSGGAGPASKAEETSALIAPLNGSTVSGHLDFIQLADGGVKVQGKLTGLPPNTVHGFHIHEVGNCSALDGSSAGPHFNPTHAHHGKPAAEDAHAGDLGNIQSDGDGQADVAVITHVAQVPDGPNSVRGRSIIVHAKRDDFTTQPSGDSGDRIACGVIH